MTIRAQVCNLTTNGSRLLVTGAARSGTGFCAQVLKRWLGGCGHEDRVHDDFDGSWQDPPLGANVSWLAAPKVVSGNSPYPVKTIILVRDPLKSINSIIRRGFLYPANPYGRFAMRVCYEWASENWPELRLPEWMWGDPARNAAAYWAVWHAMLFNLEPRVPVWRLEDLSTEAPADVSRNYNAGDRFPGAEQFADYSDKRIPAVVQWYAAHLDYGPFSPAPKPLSPSAVKTR